MKETVKNEAAPEEKTPARRRGIYLLPNLLTTGALFAGFYSIIAAIDGNFAASAGAIFIAMFLDGMDGRLVSDCENAEEIATLLESMLDDLPGRTHWGESAQRRVHDEFLVFHQARRWIETLADLSVRKIHPRPAMS